MNVRQFGIKNANSGDNEMYDLMDLNHMFMSPKGLGWGVESTTMRIGQTFLETEQNPEQPKPSGEMWFSTYEYYKEFVEFCQVGGLVLCYKPSESIPWRYLEVSVKISKTEIDHDTGYLTCDTNFTGLSRWYEAVQMEDTKGEVDADAKLYKDHGSELADSERYYYSYALDENATESWNDHTYNKDGTEKSGSPVTNIAYWYYRYNEEFSGTMSFSMGVVESYFKLTIFGACVNPEYKLYVNGLPSKSGKFNLTLSANQKLVIDTHPASLEASIYNISNNEFVRDAYGDSDFTTERIFAIPPGDSFIVISGQDSSPSAWIEVRKVVPA